MWHIEDGRRATGFCRPVKLIKPAIESRPAPTYRLPPIRSRPEGEMFSTEIDRVRSPIMSRAWGIALGTLLLITVVVALVSARTVPFLFPLTIVAFIGAALVRGNYQYKIGRASCRERVYVLV